MIFLYQLDMGFDDKDKVIEFEEFECRKEVLWVFPRNFALLFLVSVVCQNPYFGMTAMWLQPWQVLGTALTIGDLILFMWILTYWEPLRLETE